MAHHAIALIMASSAITLRVLQLMERLQVRRIGPLYREFDAALKASGYFSDEPDNGVTDARRLCRTAWQLSRHV